MSDAVPSEDAEDSFARRRAAARAAGGGPAVLACGDGLRLPTAFLASAEVAAGGWRFPELPEHGQLALALLGLEEACDLAVPDGLRAFLADPPFRLSLDGEGVLGIALAGGQPASPRIEQEAAHRWIQVLAPTAVVIDLARVPHLTSVVIAWMLQITQGARPASVRVVHANPMVVAQLRQLRLNYLMTLG